MRGSPPDREHSGWRCSRNGPDGIKPEQAAGSAGKSVISPAAEGGGRFPVSESPLRFAYNFRFII